jgi:Ca2+-binding EF-hand superfamily protein
MKLLALLGTALAGLALGAEPATPLPSPPSTAAWGASGPYDFVFLTEARPLLIRVQVRVDGKALEAAWESFFDHLFLHLDVKAQGYLGKEEAERAPPLDHITSGSLGSFFGGYIGSSPKEPAYPALKDFDTNGDGKVSKAALAAYYRKQGFTPFQVQPETDNAGGTGNAMMMMGMGNRSAEPSVDAVAGAIFSLLDTKKTGKLTRAELAMAPELLLRLDTNEDEMITVAEVAPDVPAPKPNAISMAVSSFKNALSTPSLAGPSRIFPLAAPGEVPARLVKGMLDRYAKGKKEIARKDLGLDEKTFAALDANSDGVLDAAELAGFAKRAPDVAYVVHLNSDGAGSLGVELLRSKDRPALPADKINAFDGLALLDLGAARVELRGDADVREDRFSQFAGAQWTIFFKQADKNGDGYLDEKEASASVFRTAFKAMDRDGDGKVSEQEMNAYLELLADLKARAQKACAALVLTDESRGLFDLLDVNRDGRLSVREMRGAVALLEKLAPKGKDHLSRADLPRSYRLTVRRGPASNANNDYAAVIESIYGGAAKAPMYKAPSRGPAWFRKMDKNRDGDVSRREWLGNEELFRQIDTDGDGLISAEEAERFDARRRQDK